MSETMLAIIFLVVILSLRFLVSRMPQPARLYINIISGVLLLTLVWFFAPETTRTALKILMTILVLSSLYRAYWDYKKSTRDHLLKGMQDEPSDSGQRQL